MNTFKSAYQFAIFFVCTAVLAAFGCSDANASESTYLPVDSSCPSPVACDGDDTPMIPDRDHVTTEDDAAPTGGDIDAPADHFFDIEGDDDWQWYDDPMSLTSGPYLGDGPDLRPASTTSNQQRPATERTSGTAEGIDINSADASTLTELPGIGPALAERIVDYRTSRRFDDPSELQRIKGIGPATFEDIAPYVRIE